MRWSGSLLLVAVAVASAAPRVARASDGPRFELEGGSGLMMSQAVRNVAEPNAATAYRAIVSVSGAMAGGPLVAGINFDGGFAWFGGFEGFTGVFGGSELLLDRLLLRGVVEAGMHGVVAPGSDGSHNSVVPSVALPYLGLRIATERRLMKGHELALGISGFVRVDLAHQQVSGTVTERCEFLNFDCENPQVPTTFDVGGVTFGVGISLTFGSGG
jgi:hypothetical protein